MLALSEPYHLATEAWLSRTIGNSALPLGGNTAHLEDSAFLDLIHAAIPAGPITVRDIAGLYVGGFCRERCVAQQSSEVARVY